MSNASEKKAIGVYVTMAAAVLAVAAAIYFQVIGGVFGATKRVCYDVAVVVSLVAAAAFAICLIALKRYGLASALITTLSGCSILFFVHKCYWYVSDVFVGIDEKGFDPKFLIFISLALGSFLLGEISIYMRKTKA